MKKKITITLLSLFIAGFALAETNSVKKVIVLNEGYYNYTTLNQDVPVTVGTYDPATKVYAAFDTIRGAQFATHVVTDGSSIYVAADSILVRYDANTYQRLATANLHSMRKLAIWNNQLLITRGDYRETPSSFFEVYDKTTLGFLYHLAPAAGVGPQYATEGVLVKDDIAYVAIGNGFASDLSDLKGLIGTVNLTGQSYVNEINLGTGGTNPEGMFADHENIYTVNNTDYSTSSISTVNISSQSAQTVNLGTSNGCGASGFVPGFIMFQVSNGLQIIRFNTSTSTIQDTLPMSRNIYGVATDTINSLIYMGETDYYSYGKIFIYNFSGTAVDSFDVSVSPGNIALDIRPSALGVNEPIQTHTFNCYPNPAHDEVLVVSSDNNKTGNTYILTDVTGREVKRIYNDLSRFPIDIHTFDAGIYILKSLSNPAEQIKIVKQ